MKYQLNPEAALEHEEQADDYELRAPRLGRRYHAAFKSAALRVCEAPNRCRIVSSSGLRRTSLRGFPFAIYFFEFGGTIQIVAVAHHRKRPGYWLGRLYQAVPGDVPAPLRVAGPRLNRGVVPHMRRFLEPLKGITCTAASL